MLFDINLNTTPSGNWIGTKTVDIQDSEKYCNLLVKDGKVVQIKDKEKCSDDYVAFTGLLHIQDYEQFWDSLENDTTLINGERQISNGIQVFLNNKRLSAVDMKWTDLGDIQNYHNAKKDEYDYNFEKSDEFTFFVNKKVIKFFEDKQSVENRVKRSKIK